METTEQKPLTKHIQTAVNAIEKQISKYEKEVLKLIVKARQAEADADVLRDSISGLKEQISKLKGD